MKASIPFVILDPTGAHWGLRAAADGVSAGLPVVIIGGEHGDVPLESTAGKVIADLVVDHPGFYVVDLSSTESNAEQDRFATDFAERLYRRKNKARTPLHLFVDEADAFAPQRPLPGQQRMLGAFESLVRRGGIRGIGTTLITQRPAILNKNVLTQSECLIVLQMNAPQDQDAIDDWVQRNGTREQRDIMMQSLASLQQGEAWFWSPSWLRVFKKVTIRQRRTFNSSATPKAGEKVIVPQQLAAVDLVRLGKLISETIERAHDNEPAALKRKVAELKQKVQKLEQQVTRPALRPVAEAPTKLVEIPVLTFENSALLEQIVTWMKEVNATMGMAKEFVGQLPSLRQDILNKLIVARHVAKAIPAPVMPKPRIAPPKPAVGPGHGTVVVDLNIDDITLSKCERSILRALVQYPQGRSGIQLAVLTGYSLHSGSFKNSLGRLRTYQLISRTHPIEITENGKTALGDDWEPLPTGQELIRYWLDQLSKCEKAILNSLLAVYPEGMTPDQLGEQTGYSPSSGSFKNSLGRMRTLELVQRGQPIKASEHFFQ